MSLPIIVVFERHWDEIPKHVVQELLPQLLEQGYDTLCTEAPQDMTSSEIIDWSNVTIKKDSNILHKAENLLKNVNITTKLSEVSFRTLANLMHRYVSSQRYADVAEKIKGLPAAQLKKNIFDQASELSVLVKGVDIVYEDFVEVSTTDLSTRVMNIKANESYRISTFVKNLLEVRQEREGLIFICGVLHAQNLIARLKKENVDFLYYFPHSSRRYDDAVDDIQAFAMNETLKDHTYLLSREGIESFKKRVIRQVISKTKYKAEAIEGNTHSRFLSHCFGAKFKVFVRAGYYADALVKVDEIANIEAIKGRLREKKIRFITRSLHGERYLIIPAVNTRDVAESIRKL